MSINVQAWTIVIVFGLFAWGFLLLPSVFNLPKMLEVAMAVLAGCSALIAGNAARGTWIYDLIAWFVHLSPFTSLTVMALVLIAVAVTIPILIRNEKNLTPLVAAAWVIIPSALSLGVLKGEFGAAITTNVLDLAASLTRATTGWFA